MAMVEVFDPPMCCSTGVCGPSVDLALATFAADLGWLADQGVLVERHNLSQEPKAFADSDLVRELLTERGDDALPAVVIDGGLCSSGRYPSREELVGWSLGGARPEVLDAVVTELVAIGAAVGASCEPCFKFHCNEARRLGVGPDTMAAAVRVAQAVKDAPARSMLELAAKLLGTEPGALRQGAAGTTPAPVAFVAGDTVDSGGGCCGGGTEVVEVSLAGVASGTEGTSACCG